MVTVTQGLYFFVTFFTSMIFYLLSLTSCYILFQTFDKFPYQLIISHGVSKQSFSVCITVAVLLHFHFIYLLSICSFLFFKFILWLNKCFLCIIQFVFLGSVFRSLEPNIWLPTLILLLPTSIWKKYLVKTLTDERSEI